MKDKEVVTKENYKQVVLKRAIILCWVLLAICFVVKIFGGNFFNIVCENERFIKVCDYIENTFWYYVMAYLTYITTHFILLLYIAPKIRIISKESLIYCILFSLLWVLKYVLYDYTLFLNPLLCSIVEWSIQYLIFLFITKKKFKSLLGIIYISLFLILSMFIKNLSFAKIVAENVLITLIYMIDYYIMLILVMLYSKNKYLKEKNMGLFGGSWWLHKPLAELEALLPTLKNEDERKACEKRIAKLKEKEAKKSK